MHLVYPLVLSSLLFAIGVYGVLVRRNAILMLMSVELMLNAVNLNLVAFDAWLHDKLHAGQALTLFTITIAAAEIGLGLAIVLMVFRNRGNADVDRMRELTDADGRSLFASETDPADTADDASDAEAADTAAGKKAAVA